MAPQLTILPSPLLRLLLCLSFDFLSEITT